MGGKIIIMTWSRGMSHLSKMSISIFLPHFLITSNASFWRKPHYNWISRNRVMKDLTMLKSISNKGIWTLFLPLSQKQHRQNPTHSSWSCHIFQKTNVFSLYFVWQKFKPTQPTMSFMYLINWVSQTISPHDNRGKTYQVVMSLAVGLAMPLIMLMSQERLLTSGTDKMLWKKREKNARNKLIWRDKVKSSITDHIKFTF